MTWTMFVKGLKFAQVLFFLTVTELNVETIEDKVVDTAYHVGVSINQFLEQIEDEAVAPSLF